METTQTPQAGVVLLTALLALMVSLIGEALTLSLVREGWPDVSEAITGLKTEEKQ